MSNFIVSPSPLSRGEAGADLLAELLQVVRLDEEPSGTLEVEHETLAGEERLDPGSAGLADLVGELALEGHHMAGVDDVLAVHGDLLDVAETVHGEGAAPGRLQEEEPFSGEEAAHSLPLGCKSDLGAAREIRGTGAHPGARSVELDHGD